jgi:hypothetical protein
MPWCSLLETKNQLALGSSTPSRKFVKWALEKTKRIATVGTTYQMRCRDLRHPSRPFAKAGSFFLIFSPRSMCHRSFYHKLPVPRVCRILINARSCARLARYLEIRLCNFLNSQAAGAPCRSRVPGNTNSGKTKPLRN